MWQEKKDFIWCPPTHVAHMAPGNVLSPGLPAACLEPGRCWNACGCVFLCFFVYAHKGNCMECGSMQTRAPAFMFISVSGEGECLSQEVSDVSLSQCLHAYVWARLKATLNGGKVSCFSEQRCYMLSATDGSGGPKWFTFFPLPPNSSSSSSSPVWVHSLFFSTLQEEQSTVGRDTQSSKICALVPIFAWVIIVFPNHLKGDMFAQNCLRRRRHEGCVRGLFQSTILSRGVVVVGDLFRLFFDLEVIGQPKSVSSSV